MPRRLRTRFFALTLMAAALRPAAMASADGISGYLEYNVSKGDSQIRDAFSGATVTENVGFTQKYFLALDKGIFPNLMLSAGGTFERADARADVDGVESDVTASRILPYVNLSLNTPILSVSGGYSLNRTWAEANGVSAPALVREQASARFSYLPDGFPTLDLQVGRNENYDTARTRLDTTDDFLNVSSRYAPIGNLFLIYSGAFSRGNDHLQDIESQSIVNSGTINYTQRFLETRGTFSGMYNISSTNTEFTSGGNGEIATPRIPFSGLAALSATPTLGNLQPEASLIDGDTTKNLTGGVRVDIGYSTGNTTPRNLGLDFVFANTESNTLYVWVDKKLPGNVASAYAWDVYTSNDNDRWDFVQTVSAAPFAPFDNRFEIRYRNVVARYVKVVTRPLAAPPPSTPEFPDPSVFGSIRVTELQCFLRKPAADVSREESRTAQVLNVDARVLIMDVPSVYYRVSYFLATATDSPSNYTLSNALSANHSFSQVFSGSASLQVDYSESGSGHSVIYTYNAALTAVPFPTLTHILSYGGRTVLFGGTRFNSNSLTLTNTAELYKGVNANLMGGFSQASSDSGRTSRDYNLGASLNLVPNRILNVNMTYSGSWSELAGGGKPDTSSLSRAGTVNVSITPVSAVYIYGDWGFTEEPGQPLVKTNSISVGWSPFPGGDLQFNFPYNQTYRDSNHETTRQFSPSVRWNITRRNSLTVGYTRFQSESDSTDTRSNQYNANLRIAF